MNTTAFKYITNDMAYYFGIVNYFSFYFYTRNFGARIIKILRVCVCMCWSHWSEMNEMFFSSFLWSDILPLYMHMYIIHCMFTAAYELLADHRYEIK